VFARAQEIPTERALENGDEFIAEIARDLDTGMN
jgi:hypothetical protein